MKNRADIPKEKQAVFSSRINTLMLIGIGILLMAGVAFLAYQSQTSIPEPAASGSTTIKSQKGVAGKMAAAPPAQLRIEDGKDVQTGLVAGEGLQIVKGSCTACHSSALILQNRFTREGWREKIVWMQQTQGLWDLGENEAVILDYLAAHYGVEAFNGRRRPLDNIEWYQLED